MRRFLQAQRTWRQLRCTGTATALTCRVRHVVSASYHHLHRRKVPCLPLCKTGAREARGSSLTVDTQLTMRRW